MQLTKKLIHVILSFLIKIIRLITRFLLFLKWVGLIGGN